MSEEPIYQVTKAVAEAASQPVCKLIDAIQTVVGMVYEPTHVRRMAKAEAEALIIRGQGELVLEDLRARAAARLTNTEMRRQVNIEAVVEQAKLALPNNVSEDPVDPDWIAELFDGCKDVGSEQLQKIWGRLLASEVTEPSRVSRRTMHHVRLLDATDAAIFQCLMHRVWLHNDWPVILHPDFIGSGRWSEHCPYQYHHIATLADANIVDERADEWHRKSLDDSITCEYFGSRFNASETALPHLTRFVFTSTGAELFNSVKPPAGINDAYYERCVEYFFKPPRWERDESSEFRYYTFQEDQDESMFDISERAVKRPQSDEDATVE